jgi:NAD(P)-dependent dehydrogenase (short-subunit alcohol dehydrogenase family)
MAAYNATKGALVSLTRQLAAQWGQRGVRVNALAPGYFPTELTGHLADAGFARSIREHTLLGRTPALEEIDGPLLFLATPASSYMTGQVLAAVQGERHRRRLDRILTMMSGSGCTAFSRNTRNGSRAPMTACRWD